MTQRLQDYRNVSDRPFAQRQSPTRAWPQVRDPARAGNVSLVLIGIIALFLTTVSFTVSTGEILVKQQQLQDLADATALAGAAALRDGEDALLAVANASALAAEPNASPFPDLPLSPDAVEVGRYDFIDKVFRPSQSGTDGVPAVRVVIPIDVALGEDSGSGASFAMSNFLRDQLGLDRIAMHAEAIAVVRPRDIIIVQDITGSFRDEFEYARQADLALVDIIARSYGGLGDKIGVVTFGREAYLEFQATPVGTGVEQLKEFLGSTMEVCTTTSSRHRFANRRDHRKYAATDPNDFVGRRLRRVNCLGTGTGPAIALATTILDNAVARGSDPVIVLVTDGVPCHYVWWQSSSQWVENGKTEAISAAIAAKEKGIRVFVVDLSLPPFGPDGSCLADGSGFNVDLASHGYGTTTDDPAELERKLLEVANKLTLRLVR